MPYLSKQTDGSKEQEHFCNAELSLIATKGSDSSESREVVSTTISKKKTFFAWNP